MHAVADPATAFGYTRAAAAVHSPEGEWDADVRGTPTQHLAEFLGVFSVGLGLAQLFAPRQLGRLIGVGDHPELMRLLGLRELGAGVGVLLDPKPAEWLWARSAGDAIDLALLGRCYMQATDANRTRIAIATAAVLGVTALDVLAATELSGD